MELYEQLIDLPRQILDLKEIGWSGVDWIHLPRQRPVAGSCEHGNDVSGSVKCWIILE
jgi:hypothetical protein